MDAAFQCGLLGAHLAVPRSEQENQCALSAIGDRLVWIGLNDVEADSSFVGADGCESVPSTAPVWASGEPDALDEAHHVVMVSALSPFPEGWHDNAETMLRYPLCQLPACYQPDCQ